jgi:hypothetical protein
MSKDIFKAKIHQAVIDNRLDLALAELLALVTDVEHTNAVLLLTSRLNEIKKEEQLGLEDGEVTDRKMNRLRLAVLEIVNAVITDKAPEARDEITGQLERLLDALDINRETFFAQSRIRDQLAGSLLKRFPEIKRRNVANILSERYTDMTPPEKRMHRAIRGYTQTVIRKYNQEVLSILKANSGLKNAVANLSKLEHHIIIWLSKYESTFEADESICLVYLQVEEQAPFPKGIESEIRSYLATKK